MELRRFLLMLLLGCTALSALSAQSSKPIVSKIEAVTNSAETTVSWSLPAESSFTSVKALNVYRSQEAILSPDQVAVLEPVAILAPDTNSYHDKGQSSACYYAILAVQENGTVYDVLIPTVNTTVYKAQKTVKATEDEPDDIDSAMSVDSGFTSAGLRMTPLPAFQIFSTDTDMPEPISDELLYAASFYGIESGGHDKAELYICAEDLPDDSTGDTYLIHAIVTNYMLKKNWARAQKELATLLQTYHSDEIVARINLYQGQCFYFMKDYLSALRCFLQAETLYPDLSKIWMQTAINAFDLPDSSKQLQ